MWAITQRCFHLFLEVLTSPPKILLHNPLSFFHTRYRLIAGDKCVPGQERAYFPMVKPCLVGIPQGFSLTSNATYITPNQPVHFTFIQQQVSDQGDWGWVD